MLNKYYTHIKTGKQYKVVAESIVKVDGVWVASVVYISSDPAVTLTFVRFRKEFRSKFKDSFYDSSND